MLTIPKEFFIKIGMGQARSGTGESIEKRPDSMKLFERKRCGIQLKNDDFRNY